MRTKRVKKRSFLFNSQTNEESNYWLRKDLTVIKSLS